MAGGAAGAARLEALRAPPSRGVYSRQRAFAGASRYG